MSGADVVAGVYEAFGRGDIAGVLAAMDSQIHWREAEGNPYRPGGEAWVGPEAVVNNLFIRLAEEWDGFAANPATFHDAGEVVTVEGRYTARHNETGKALDAQFCHVWTLRDGKIANFQQYVDTAKLQEVMGTRVA